MSGLISVVAGKKIKLVLGTTSTPGTAENDATTGPETKIQYNGTGSYVDILTSSPAGEGEYDVGGSGAGGVGSTATVDGGVVSPSFSKDGAAGKAGASNEGGRGGFRWGQPRAPANNLGGVPSGAGITGTGQASQGGGGGGSDAMPGSPSLAGGGAAPNGVALVVYYAS